VLRPWIIAPAAFGKNVLLYFCPNAAANNSKDINARRVREAGLSRILLALLLLPSCDDTAVQLVFHSRLRIPEELDAICLQVAGAKEVVFSRRYPLSSSDAGHSHSISVVAGEKNPSQFEFMLRGELRGQQVSWLRETISFGEGVATKDVYVQRCTGASGKGTFTTGGRLTSGAGSVVSAMPAAYAAGQMVVAWPSSTRRFAMLDGTVHQIPGDLPVATGKKLRRAVTADLDGDCDLDVVLLHDKGPEVWLNTADGKLTRKAGALPVKHDYVDGAAADLDNDGLADLVLVSPKKTSLLLSDTLAPGTFRDASTQLPSTGVDQATGVAIGHLDGNAHLDVVLARGDTSAATNTVLYNDTAGLARFSRQGTQPADKARTGAVAVADMTGDGLGEIVFGNTSSATVVYSPTLQKKLNKVYTVPKSSSGGVLDLLAVDLDNDCDVDLVLARDAGIRVLLNKGKDKTGKPTFSESALGSAALPARSLAAVDVTGDGLNDLLLGGDKIGANWLYQK